MWKVAPVAWGLWSSEEGGNFCRFFFFSGNPWDPWIIQSRLATFWVWWQLKDFTSFNPTWEKDPIWLILVQMGWNHQLALFGLWLLGNFWFIGTKAADSSPPPKKIDKIWATDPGWHPISNECFWILSTFLPLGLQICFRKEMSFLPPVSHVLESWETGGKYDILINWEI